ncbi:MAG: response regulator [Tannerellaceae bacterium]|jgi:signal transduction histidine kinase/ligand-binding sensor domain-containing protein/DNA-binding response OmpR family regulator|nr:response regulator [Tannerellaceae bacterium]
MKKTLVFIFIYLFVGGKELKAQPDTQSKIAYLYTAENGLSSTKVTRLMQDNNGFIWIGTEDGLNRHDGFNFVIYKKRQGDTLSLKSNHITSLFQDSNGRLWVGTTKGLAYYDPVHEGFVGVSLGQPDHVVKRNNCIDIIEDSKGQLWFAAFGTGVLRYSPQTEESMLLAFSEASASSTLCSAYVRTLVEDKEGNMWFGSQDNGISVYNPATGAFTNYNTSNSPLPSNHIYDLLLLRNGNILISMLKGGAAIFDTKKKKILTYPDVFNTTLTHSILHGLEDHEGNLLLGTENYGLVIFDPEKRRIEQHPIFREHFERVGDSKVSFIYEGLHHYLWIALNYEGVYCVGNENSGFKSLRKINNQPNSLSCNPVTGITTDREKNVWITTDGGGLNRYNPFTGNFTHYTYHPRNSRSLSDNTATCVFCDSKDRIWVGTRAGGLCLLDRQTGEFSHIKRESGLPSNFIKSIQEDRYGFLWLGTSRGGLSRFDPEKKRLLTFRHASHPLLADDLITTLFIDSRDRLWIGTNLGISCMDVKSGAFIPFAENNWLSGKTIFSIAETEDGTMWIGAAIGMNRYDPDTKDFTLVYPLRQELSSTINGLVAYGNQLWMSTNHGIIRYTPENKEVKRYYKNSGLPSNEFIAGSYYKSPDGELYFGGINGVNFFRPEDIYNYDAASKVYITNLKIFNKPVLINQKTEDGRVILKQSITETKKIKLKYSDKNFTIDYVAMGIFDSYSVVYACMLAGFDKNWTYYDYTYRSITYTNLNPGTYTFRIKASSNPDIWGDESTNLIIEIEPAPWDTWWAKVIYALIGCLVVYILARIALLRIKEKNELQLQRLKVKQQEEINDVRIKFFTNISHEFRTPLTLIIDPMKRMIAQDKNDERKKTGFLILRNAERLQHLINQILDLNKIEEGKMELHVEPIELVSFVSRSIGTFTEITKQKHISLTYTWNPDRIDVWYDPDMLDKCLNNILYNAYKFTSEGGKIHVDIQQDEEGKTLLTITDTGIGMSEEVRKQVFDRFFQGNTRMSSTGTGIGMHLTKTIVELHKGAITVESEEGKGSSFRIAILPGNSHFTPEELEKDTTKNGYAQEMEEPDEYLNELLPRSSRNSSKKEPHEEYRPTLLIVEDDDDLRSYIRGTLIDQYDIEEAANGIAGLAKARVLMPDLIITDVMMPEMNGMEFCRILKTDQETSHIPVIILTAQKDMDHRLEGLENGADSYISKPFDTRYLRIRVKKLIEIRRVMKEHFGKSIDMDAREVTLTSTDEKLLQHVIDYIRENIENPELSVETMSRELGLSRTHLHRKLKALIGQSPVEFIKTIRMKQAAYLLNTGKLSVSEVAYKVGYNTPSYFSSSFNTHFGMSPTTYMEQTIVKQEGEES